MKRILYALCIAAGLALSLSNGIATAQSGNTWNVFYYNNPNWAGNPVFTNTAPTLNFNWNGASPAPNVPGTNWALTANTSAYFNGGQYQFDALADDEVLLTVDNAIVIDTRGQNQVGKRQLRQYGLSAGVHNLQVYYRQFGGTSYLYLNWSYLKPGPNPPAPPNLQHPLPPSSASTVTTPFGDYTPCIQKNIHQSNCFVQNGAWNSPNLGSIQMEPQITIWGNCSPADKDVIWTVDPNTRPPRTQTFRCSKTLAGWFPS
ncbi:MAG: hypothetical protein HY741_21180 [Chloroflexi bacterium]|nr:hypothetical protein [Chloroflexota bacterium]